MTLSEVLEWLKTLSKFDNYYIGTLDSKKNRSLGVYNLKRDTAPILALGRVGSYSIKRISLLIHWDNNADSSEKQALDLYKAIFNARPTKIGETSINFVGMLVNEPIDVGRDDKGICEYVIEFEIYYKKNKEEM